MEAISCGTPMLAANAQGYAMYLTHGVNAARILLRAGVEASFEAPRPKNLMETARISMEFPFHILFSLLSNSPRPGSSRRAARRASIPS